MTSPEDTAGAPVEEGGDAACWLERVCAECGAFRETPDPVCARCDTPYPAAPLPFAPGADGRCVPPGPVAPEPGGAR
jgi:hypothetical protein